MAAARNGRHNSVVKLLEYKANPDLQDDVSLSRNYMGVYTKVCDVYLTLQSGWSALMAAVWRSHVEVALRLIEAGATPDIQDKVRLLLHMTDVMPAQTLL